MRLVFRPEAVDALLEIHDHIAADSPARARKFIALLRDWCLPLRQLPAETVGLREANQDFSALVERVARTGRGVTVTRRGVPVVRIVPVDEDMRGLTAEQSALLERTLGEKLELVPWRFERDALHER